MLKKSSKFICILLAILLFISTTASAQQPIRVFLDGGQLNFDVPPTTIDGRTMVPMRVIFEELGAEVQWNEATRTITATRDDVIVQTTIGNRNVQVNSNRTTIDVAPVTINGRTLVPLRFVSEAFGAEVEWNANARVVNIYSNVQSMNIEENFHHDEVLYEVPFDINEHLEPPASY